jgi:hypothetical protein
MIHVLLRLKERLKATYRLELDGNSSRIWGYTSNARRARGSMDSENKR